MILTALGWFGGFWPRVGLLAAALAAVVWWRAEDVSAIRAAERARIAEQDRNNVTKADSAARKSRSNSGGLLDPYARRD